MISRRPLLQISVPNTVQDGKKPRLNLMVLDMRRCNIAYLKGISKHR